MNSMRLLWTILWLLGNGNGSQSPRGMFPSEIQEVNTNTVPRSLWWDQWLSSLTCFFHLTLFTPTDCTLYIFANVKLPNALFGSFVAFGNSLMTMLNYFQNFRLQSAGSSDSPIINQETFLYGEILLNGIQTIEITWDITRLCRPTINCKFPGFPYHQIFVRRFSDLVTNLHFNFFNCSLIVFVTSWQRMSQEDVVGGYRQQTTFLGTCSTCCAFGLYRIILINNRWHLIQEWRWGRIHWFMVPGAYG